jgi:hypothetical protein
MITLGKIVKSNSHTDYVCQIYGKHETEYVPTSEDYAFGTFVSVELSEKLALVGLIYDTVLMNPDFGRLGPRLSSEEDLALFSPDYLNERAVLTGIVVIGQVNQGVCYQGIPRVSAISDSLVRGMSEDEIVEFHHPNNHLQVAYLPQLIQRADPLARQLALTVMHQLSDLLPEQHPLLHIIEDDLNWQLQISAMGRR